VIPLLSFIATWRSPSQKKRDRRGTKNRKNTTMANSTPPPGSPYIVPPGVTNAKTNIASKPPSSTVPPDVGFDDWTAADTERIVAMSGCSDDRLRACIVAASSSVWGVREMYPTQIDAVYRLLHPLRTNYLAVIQRTGAGKTHIVRTLGVKTPHDKQSGTFVKFTPLSTSLFINEPTHTPRSERAANFEVDNLFTY
jgi:hypothetical protein